MPSTKDGAPDPSSNGCGEKGPALALRIGQGLGLGVSLGDSWQSTGLSSISPGGKSSLEASLSAVAGDGTAAFEPPAPPTANNLVGDWNLTNRPGMHVSARDSAVSLPGPCAKGITRDGGAAAGAQGCGFAAHLEGGVGRRAEANASATSTREERVLHGVSAAVASCALAGPAGPGSSGHALPSDRWEHGGCGSPEDRGEDTRGGGSAEWDFGTNAERNPEHEQDGGDRTKLARKQIDQALRERALRRSHSDELVPSSHGESSGRWKPFSDDEARESMLPTPGLRSEMGSVNALLWKGINGNRGRMGEGRNGGRGTATGERVGSVFQGGSDEARFINLGELAQRARIPSLQKDVPGRPSGGRNHRTRPTATSSKFNGGNAVTAAKSAAIVRVYGTPHQNSR